MPCSFPFNSFSSTRGRPVSARTFCLGCYAKVGVSNPLASRVEKVKASMVCQHPECVAIHISEGLRSTVLKGRNKCLNSEVKHTVTGKSKAPRIASETKIDKRRRIHRQGASVEELRSGLSMLEMNAREFGPTCPLIRASLMDEINATSDRIVQCQETDMEE